VYKHHLAPKPPDPHVRTAGGHGIRDVGNATRV
jgi:hypothetical protein